MNNNNIKTVRIAVRKQSLVVPGDYNGLCSELMCIYSRCCLTYPTKSATKSRRQLYRESATLHRNSQSRKPVEIERKPSARVLRVLVESRG